MSNPLETRKIRYKMPRWKIAYAADNSELAKFALNELQKAVQERMPYVVEVLDCESIDPSDNMARTIVMGCPADSKMISGLLEKRKLSIPEKSESYVIDCFENNGAGNGKTVLIAAKSSKGLANGVFDFCAFNLGVETVCEDLVHIATSLDEMPVKTKIESPSLENRGIWTWGYTIYDYRRFLDNMARLRMNMITIWNDAVPENINDIIEYSHNRGIKVILGFHWGWGFDNIDLSNAEERKLIEDNVVENYEKNYAGINHDGIYFQTLTETHERLINGEPRAKFVCELVNSTSARLYEKHPDLYIQFGVHAMSILEDYPIFKDIDNRIDIVWENAGVIPFSYTAIESYDSALEGTTFTMSQNLGTLDATIEYSKNLTDLRDGYGLSLVPKGFIGLRWGSEFENHGRFILGERSELFIRKRMLQQQGYWEKINGHWMRNYDAAHRFYKELRNHSDKPMTATALIEDGMFEAKIQPSVALYADLIWNTELNVKDYPLRAYSNYYRTFDI